MLRLPNMLRSERAQGKTEYLILVFFIAIAAIGAVAAFGDGIRDVFGVSTAALSGEQSASRNGRMAAAVFATDAAKAAPAAVRDFNSSPAGPATSAAADAYRAANPGSVVVSDAADGVQDYGRYAQNDPAEPAATRTGGAHKDIEAAGGERHHAPSQQASPYSKGEGPAMRMETEDHRQTASWGSSAEAKAYRKKQEELIKQGKFKEAQDMDVRDIRSKFDDKYEKEIKDLRDYSDELLKKKPLPAPTPPAAVPPADAVRASADRVPSKNGKSYAAAAEPGVFHEYDKDGKYVRTFRGIGEVPKDLKMQLGQRSMHNYWRGGFRGAPRPRAADPD